MELSGKHVVVMGGSSGIGFAVAMAATKSGARVSIVGRSRDRLEEASRRLGGAGGRYVADAGVRDQLIALSSKVGQIDHLVLCLHDVRSVVLGQIVGPLKMIDLDAAQRYMFSKFWTQFAAMQILADNVAPHGSITLTSGDGGRRPHLNYTATGPVNMAVEGFGKKAALELAPKRVNIVSPGITRTPTFAGMSDEDREAFYADYGRKLPTGRVGRPDDVAEAYVYLMRADHATGSVVDVEGGSLIRD